MNERDQQFFRPLWRRVALVAAVAAWTAWEVIAVREPIWMIVTAGILAYAVWAYFITWKDGDKPS